MPSNQRGTLATSPAPSSPSFKRKRKSCVRKFERCCCNCIIYFPLVFVYGLTSWAVWVQACVGLAPSTGIWTGYTSMTIGIVFFLLLNWSYTTAVFTDPGSPLTQTTNAYSVVPSDDEDDDEEVTINSRRHAAPMPEHNSLTVKSSGEVRYCKKCHSRKPDRAHHCSTCRRCVLKMDHHCPWLATCVGFRNYKPFLLFLIYTSLFCWLCFLVTGVWVWNEISGGNAFADSDRLMPVNIILLAVLSGIIALVLSGFTGWHLYLTCTGQTTIESLEKTRYLAPLRKAIKYMPNNPSRNHIHDSNGDNNTQNIASQLREIHANALPGITRPEEGEELIPPSGDRTPSPAPRPNTNTSPAHASLRQNLSLPHHHPTPQQPPSPLPPPTSYAAAEAARERARYTAYLDDLDAQQLPHAFDLGLRANLAHVFGPAPALWALPVCNTTGDGWAWTPSRRWLDTRDRLARDRAARLREDEAFARDRADTMPRVQPPPPPPPPRARDGDGGRGVREGIDSSSSDDDDDDDVPLRQRAERLQRAPQRQAQQWGREGPTTGNWNDIPDDILAAAGDERGPPPSRAKPRSRVDDEGWSQKG